MLYFEISKVSFPIIFWVHLVSQGFQGSRDLIVPKIPALWIPDN